MQTREVIPRFTVAKMHALRGGAYLRNLSDPTVRATGQYHGMRLDLRRGDWLRHQGPDHRSEVPTRVIDDILLARSGTPERKEGTAWSAVHRLREIDRKAYLAELADPRAWKRVAMWNWDVEILTEPINYAWLENALADLGEVSRTGVETRREDPRVTGRPAQIDAGELSNLLLRLNGHAMRFALPSEGVLLRLYALNPEKLLVDGDRLILPEWVIGHGLGTGLEQSTFRVLSFKWKRGSQREILREVWETSGTARERHAFRLSRNSRWNGPT